ncbi:MAG: hypothetical protein ACRCUY_10930, partial [Thermoguttaceae bacterium]
MMRSSYSQPFQMCRCFSFFVIVLLSWSFCSGFFSKNISAADWNGYCQSVSEHPNLIRYYVVGKDTKTTKRIPNRAPSSDVPDSEMIYKTDQPFSVVRGPFSDASAVQIDAGWFEAVKPQLDKAFTFEIRLRPIGLGSGIGNSGSQNGTLFGLGNGWDNGIRLTTQYPAKNLTFSIGRNTNEKSRNLSGIRPIDDGCWQLISAVWDGKIMSIYVNGFLYAFTDYDGVLT